MSVLQVDGLEKRFGALAAVGGVSFSVGAGEVCGLVGPNGSGKSTLLNLVSGVLAPTAGTATFQGTTITGAPAHVASSAGVKRTFQLLRLLRGQTVRENVLVGTYGTASDRSLVSAVVQRRGARGEQHDAVDAIMERVGIARYSGDFVENLSFGIQRKVELARALVSDPRLLLLDEPASGLDEGSIADLAMAVREQVARGTTVVLVDHHLEFVIDLCPRVLVMNYGKLIYDGDGRAASDDPGVREAYIGQ